ncbi:MULTISPECIES: CHAT domain-containing protein [Cyanophyceae]|uniref:CHAT domain-containing protein n=1 Tax=Cyanophyceae TaxID=3028117 RepID=UPI00168293C6|nr:CHAT domain-containing protein [Trichocoleus sp. FACHB-69]MBD1931817.1 CHAT domain-containing protein [Trichocoleus sp. FACHB-69]
MKSVVSSIGVSLAGLYIIGSVSREPILKVAIASTPNPISIAQAAKPSKVEIALDEGNLTEAVPQIETTWEKQYEDYFRVAFPDKSITAKDVANTLDRISKQTGKNTALVYVFPREQQLELVLITPKGKPIHKRILAAKREVLLETVKDFRKNVVNHSIKGSKDYFPAARQLHQWIIAPLEADLETNNIDTLIFCMGVGLRTMPLAAFHDGQKFLIEKYSIGRIPAFKLTDTRYADIKNSPVLAMGASKFKEQEPLPAVPVELSAITQKLRRGKSFLNQEFTLDNLQSQRASQPFKIIHLATHADFLPGVPSNSYVQFWDEKLRLNQMKHLSWNNPPVELLVLSACRTALGDKDAELGFAGLAVNSGVKSALASLWYVSDEGTLGLMTEFYRHLATAPIKAEALRQGQIAMLKGQVRIENGQLHSPRGNISLPPELAGLGNQNLSHPYYWAAFTIVGSPW